MSVDGLLIAGTLLARRRVRQRDRWSRERMLAFQRVELQRLLAYARASSPYYREVLPGAGDVPLADLPVLTKSVLMEQWDRISTSPGLRLAQLEGRLAQMERTGADPGHPWRGRWWLAGTGGTTGRRAVFAWDRQEWTQILTCQATSFVEGRLVGFDEGRVG